MRRFGSRSGQSIIDVLIASGVGAILLVGALSVLTPALRGSRDAERAQDGATLARGLQDAVRSLAASNWNAIASLTAGSPYYIQQNATGSTVIAGTETLGGGSAEPANLVSRFSFDDSSTSTLSNSVAGAQSGTGGGTGTATTSSCQVGTCWSFNGSGYVSVPNSSEQNQSAITVVGWFKMGATGKIAYNKEGQLRFLAGDVSANHLAIRYATNSTAWGSGTLTGGTALSLNTWYQLAATYDGANWKLYVNGNLDGTRAETGTIVNAGVPLYIGDYTTGSGSYTYQGSIDDLRTYSRALTQAEIQQLYTGSGGGTALTRSFSIGPVRRNSSGAYVSSGGYVDSSTLALTVTYQWPTAQPKSLTSFLTRSASKALVQTDWSGGGGLNATTTDPGNQFASSTAIDYSTVTGSMSVDFAAVQSGGGGGSGGIVASPTSDHYAWNDLLGWINFYSSGTVTVTASKVQGYADTIAGSLSLDCATSPSGNICGTSNYYVTNNGGGTLGGYAWNDTYGWFSFNCANHGCATSTYGVAINPTTGVFSGYAWNDLAGWVSFNCADIAICGTSNYKVVTDWRSVAGSATLDSAIIDTGIATGAQVNGITWTGSKPAGTDLRLQVATANSSSGPWNYLGPDGTGSSYYTPDAGSGAALYPWVHAAGRYFRYRAILVTDVSQSATPRVDDVVVRWSP